MHIIEIPFTNAPQAKAFLSALFYSNHVSAIGYRYVTPQKTVAVAIDHEADESSDIDFRISKMIDENLENGSGDDFDESELYLMKIYPGETKVFSPEREGTKEQV